MWWAAEDAAGDGGDGGDGGVVLMSSDTAFNLRGGATGVTPSGCAPVDASRFKLVFRNCGVVADSSLDGAAGCITAGCVTIGGVMTGSATAGTGSGSL